MRKILLIIIFVFLIIVFSLKFYTYFIIRNSSEFKIFLAYNPSLLLNHEYAIRAYASVLQEEGIPFQRIDYSILNSISINAAPWIYKSLF